MFLFYVFHVFLRIEHGFVFLITKSIFLTENAYSAQTQSMSKFTECRIIIPRSPPPRKSLPAPLHE